MKSISRIATKALLGGGGVLLLVFALASHTATAASGTFTATGDMTTVRVLPTATLLPSGKVLIAGGAGGATNPGPVGSLATAELYDPATGGFNATDSMTIARVNHTATLLPSGKALIAGGTVATANVSSLATAELYDPATGSFSPTGSMTTARSGHIATLLPNGKILIAGGVDTPTNGTSLSSAELYDPSTGLFSPTGTMTAARRYTTLTGTAILLPSGKVLIAGGVGAAQAILATAELYDPATGSFNATGSMAAGRFLHTATLLQGGAVLVAGGVGAQGELASAELYDLATGSFSATGSTTTARLAYTETLLPDGMILITGGNNAQGYLASAELYDPATGGFSATGSMATARRSHTATLLPSGAVLVAGGESANAAFASAELYVSNPVEDDCPNSDLSATVVIDGCNSGVLNALFPSGCTISDLIAACAEGASNHGQFVSCVSHMTNDLKKAGTITGQQKGAIQRCAAQADIP